MYYATDQCWKRLEACINAELGHSEHLLWLVCLTFQFPHTTTSSFQSHWWQPSTGSFQSLQRLKERNKPSVRWKSFAVHKLVLWHFQVGWASGLQFVFSWHHNQFYSEPPMTTHNWLSLDPPVFERTQQTCPVKSTVDYITAENKAKVRNVKWGMCAKA